MIVIARHVYIADRAKTTKSYENWIRDNVLYCFFPVRKESQHSKKDLKRNASFVNKTLIEMLQHDTSRAYLRVS
jgi:hypothetical protein